MAEAHVNRDWLAPLLADYLHLVIAVLWSGGRGGQRTGRRLWLLHGNEARNFRWGVGTRWSPSSRRLIGGRPGFECPRWQPFASRRRLEVDRSPIPGAVLQFFRIDDPTALAWLGRRMGRHTLAWWLQYGLRELAARRLGRGRPRRKLAQVFIRNGIFPTGSLAGWAESVEHTVPWLLWGGRPLFGLHEGNRSRLLPLHRRRRRS